VLCPIRYCHHSDGSRRRPAAVSATWQLLDAGLLQVNCTYRFAARDGLTKLHLQECLTANNSRTKPDIDVIFAPKCASQSKDAETCKKSKSEISALTGFLRPMDDMLNQIFGKFDLKCLFTQMPIYAPKNFVLGLF